MTRALDVWIWVVMRLTSMVLAVAVFVHLGTMIYVIQDGLSAQEILGRTQGSAGWYLFYAIFLIAAAIHAAIGLRTIVREHTAWKGGIVDFAALIAAAGLVWLGLWSLQGLF